MRISYAAKLTKNFTKYETIKDFKIIKAIICINYMRQDSEKAVGIYFKPCLYGIIFARISTPLMRKGIF